MKFAVLITCFNRVESTLECLRHLFAARLPEGCAMDVWLNDDGCTDGTGERVAKEFPMVKVVKGSGHDYWCGGMRRVWDAAARHLDYDGYLWLNDDTMLNANALEIMFDRVEQAERVDRGDNSRQDSTRSTRPKENDAILVGAICGKDGKATYGGEDERGRLLAPDGGWRRLYKMNGNVAWIPRRVFQALGNFPDYLTHALGDHDYSRRADEHGIGVWLSPNFLGVCEKNSRVPVWKNPKAPLARRLSNLYSPLGCNEPPVYFRYVRSHFGLLKAARTLASNHLRAFFPGLWK